MRFVHLEFVHLLNSVLFDIDIGIFKFDRSKIQIFWKEYGYNYVLLLLAPGSYELFPKEHYLKPQSYR